ncbi:MAG: hypothetical protein ACI4IR_01575 [Eubacterium sp.]
MIYSIVSLDDIFYSPSNTVASVRSSNPYDYIRDGYYLDNADIFGGENYVSFNSNISSHRTGSVLGATGVGKRTQRNIP